MTTKLRDLIQSRMDRDGLTYMELAERVGIGASTLNRMVNNGGKHTPDLSTLAKIGLALNIPLYELVEAVGFDLGLTSAGQNDILETLYRLRHLPQDDRLTEYQTLPPQLREAIAAIVEAYDADKQRRLRG